MADSYDDLPECIKGTITQREFDWLPDSQKRNIESDYCTPDTEEFDCE